MAVVGGISWVVKLMGCAVVYWGRFQCHSSS